MRISNLIAFMAASFAAVGQDLAGQHREHQHEQPTVAPAAAGWTLSAMGQVFPALTVAEPFDRDSRIHDRASYLTQPVLMMDLTSPGRSLTTRVTWNFEQLTQPDGEYTLGGWGEGFIDKRHPHTLLHEAMVSWTAWRGMHGAVSLSAGKGFAPYGTDDPMGRPALKFPTNHHLSQIPERWTVIGAFAHPSGWSLEGGLFGGAEPADAYDFGNIESFGDSWSVRVVRRGGAAGDRPWAVSGSFARLIEAHGGEKESMRLANASGRFEARGMYALLEGSRSWGEDGDGFWALLAETQVQRGRHAPYARLEWATRPELHRMGAPGTPEYFRYLPHGHADGATRWLITTLGYGFDAGAGSVSTRPFIEIQHHSVWAHRGDVDPATLFGRSGLWSVSTGLRLFIGGGPMRMGTYGSLDALASGHTPGSAMPGHAH